MSLAKAAAPGFILLLWHPARIVNAAMRCITKGIPRIATLYPAAGRHKRLVPSDRRGFWKLVIGGHQSGMVWHSVVATP